MMFFMGRGMMGMGRHRESPAASREDDISTNRSVTHRHETNG